MLKNHFVNDYMALVANLKENFDEKTAMSKAVGSNFEGIGQIEADLLRMQGLKDGMKLIDIGCGSGRTATVLARDFSIDYHGTDIVPDLISYARKITPETYRFTVVDGLAIPDADACADMVCAFSLFTHLLHEETFIYLEEVRRVLKQNGVLVFSFLEFAEPHLWGVFEYTKLEVINGRRTHLNVFIERNAIEVWARHLGFSVEQYIGASQGATIPLSRDATMDDGHVISGIASLGQSVCVLRKL